MAFQNLLSQTECPKSMESSQKMFVWDFSIYVFNLSKRVSLNCKKVIIDKKNLWGTLKFKPQAVPLKTQKYL
jgi:hypothetical protein